MAAKKKAAATETAPAAPAITIANCDEADRRGLDLGKARLEREALQNEVLQKKNAIDQEYTERLEKLATVENALQAALDAFANEFAMTVDLNYIEIVSAGGGNAVFYDVDEEELIKRLKRSEVWKTIVKSSESVSKRDLAKIPEKLHKKFGFRYGPTKVTYSVKPKLDQVRLYVERKRGERATRQNAAKR
jgi:hypothetical protein